MPLYEDGNAIFYDANIPLWGCKYKSHNANTCMCNIDNFFSFLIKSEILEVPNKGFLETQFIIFFMGYSFLIPMRRECPMQYSCPKNNMSYFDLRLLKVGDNY